MSARRSKPLWISTVISVTVIGTQKGMQPNTKRVWPRSVTALDQSGVRANQLPLSLNLKTVERIDHHKVPNFTCYFSFTDLSVGDTSRNIIEMIFRATSMSPGSSGGKIERVLKVNNSREILERFEHYREMVKSRAEMLQQQKGNPRSIADGNELLRFHSTTMACCPPLTEKLSSLCRNAQCGVCRTIESGFTTEEMKRNGIRMTATGLTGEDLVVSQKVEGGAPGKVKRAVVVCRVIAGMVLSVGESESFVRGDGFDSVVGKGGLCSKWGDLYVSNPSAVLPCFVIIYSCKAKAL